MAITFDNALGVHQHTVGVRGKRAETLSSNIANANTPGYKAQDIDFQRALKAASSEASIGLSRTNERHIAASSRVTGEKKYRVPSQPDTGDGNTVDAQLEKNLFMQNALEYQASLDFLGSKFKNMKKALNGK
ncbi:flagellar basal body rod protein FlgB [Salinivibrio sp. MA351]|jgi:flagellar basal-body rod protein FlgB|uniref:Flagellar basal body rod protein FlgB n=1 Tax=Salinivibrio costicola subsp. alcaliphilus TaxID=272773 RepID=A0ABX3KSY6_SALCS|nr:MULTISPECIES: flagellar basal body rod protein FlgB [Salinivibrio]NUY56262.1 flagellar basal body rod protein FlgB [Salinivibrio sp. EAGSL]OOE93235.1 flagellar basal body rod protein FlgB [Salinivibrio sp. AR647]OOE93537.1 flagellar basal body rod protein FlgB [Salinivibrio sp. AR640]OOE99081.1 flagellar basal body rod protein FlgB [Salinivibrio sp. IB643]OOF00675.1 flagellar basal body rod protein FlgB [Salinivibrio sp. MA351]